MWWKDAPKDSYALKKILVIGGSLFLLFGASVFVSAVVIDPSMQFVVQNETYTVNSTMVFDQIIISDTSIVFNDTGFYITAPNSITITLIYINDDVSGAVNGEKLLDFYATTASGTVPFDLSGFAGLAEYLIRRNGNVHATSTATVGGMISFSNAVWSGTQRFTIYQQAAAPSDPTPPQISGVTRSTSNPLDTSSSYGWVNVSCTATDNIAVSLVTLRIRSPSGSWNNVSMTTRTVGNYYYRSTTAFSSVGNYSYSIQARDSSNNVATTSTVVFSMPPNWDVNLDGIVTIMDLVLLSNRYGQSSGNGWVREDVDNNGRIEVLDLVLVSSHFGEEWWV